MGLDLQNLSKIKKIYHVYTSYDRSKMSNIINVEEFPVVYTNKKYVYYVVNNKYTLDYRYIENVYQNFVEYLNGFQYNMLEKAITDLCCNINCWCLKCNKDAVVDMYNITVKKLREEKIKANKESTKQAFLKAKMFTQKLFKMQ